MLWTIGSERHSVFLLIFMLLLAGATALGILSASEGIPTAYRMWQAMFILFYLGLAISLWYFQKFLFLIQVLLLGSFSFILAGLPLLQPEIFSVLNLGELHRIVPTIGERSLLPWQAAFHYLVLPVTGLWLLMHRSLRALFEPHYD